MLEVHRQVELRAPVLLCAFTGWSDAASGASGALSYLLMKWPGQALASFDAETIYSYTVTRPVVRYSRRRQTREVRWPALTVTALPMPHAEHDLVVLLGPEPDLRWQAIARAAVEHARQIGVERVLALGSFYAPVAHTAPVPLVGMAYDPELRASLRALDLGETNYQGPTGFLTALLDTARRGGLAAAGVWGVAPSYLPGVTNTKVSDALLRTVERVLHVVLGRAELEVTARDLEQRIEQALRERPDLREFVEKLRARDEEQAQLIAEPDVPPEDPGELPSADAVLQDLEQYLRQLQQGDENR
jgi:proteasome assembly chaperone (PAC2) family protein